MSTNVSGANPVEIERLMVERLTAHVGKDNPDEAKRLAKFVYDQSEYARETEESQLVPACAVIYNGFRPLDNVGPNPTVQQVEFEFLVVVITQSAKDTMRSSGSKAQASELFGAVISALLGWKPVPGCKAMVLGDTPGQGTSEKGFTYLPISFKTTVTYKPTTPT